MTWYPLRITNVWAKVAYFSAWVLFNLVTFNSLLGWMEPWIRWLIGLPLDVAWFVIAVRCFRVAGEPLVPRPWWKATGRAKASIVLGVLTALTAMTAVASAAIQPERALENVLPVMFWGPVSVYFFNSGIRLRRNPPPPAPKLAAPLPKQKRLDLR